MGSGPTWHQDLAPLVSRACSGCHVEGGIAPFALTTYLQAKPMAGAMKSSVASKRMPPWMPGGKSPELLHARALSASEVALFAAWADAGALEGDAATAAPLLPPDLVQLGAADLQVQMAQPYVPSMALSDDYRCFLIPLGLTEDRMAVAFEVTPGNRKTVHHVIVSLADAADQPAIEALDAKDSGPGWQCFGGPFPAGSGITSEGGLGSWVPGVQAVEMAAGTGSIVRAGALAVMQVHYNTLGGYEPDTTRLAVRFAPKGAAVQQLATLRLRPDVNIPAGAANHVAERSLTARQWAAGRFYPDGDAYLLAVSGHMHTLGTSFQLEVRSAAGLFTALDIPAWDFHWQGSYQLKTPVRLNAGDTLTVRCTYDNSAANREAQGQSPLPTQVTWGEGTQDEMCIGYLSIVDRLP